MLRNKSGAICEDHPRVYTVNFVSRVKNLDNIIHSGHMADPLLIVGGMYYPLFTFCIDLRHSSMFILFL
jgi:hypothetical protein